MVERSELKKMRLNWKQLEFFLLPLVSRYFKSQPIISHGKYYKRFDWETLSFTQEDATGVNLTRSDFDDEGVPSGRRWSASF